MLRLYLYARVRFLCAFLHARPRVQQAPGVPCALFSGRNDLQSPGKTRRGNAEVCFVVIARSDVSAVAHRAKAEAANWSRGEMRHAVAGHTEPAAVNSSPQ